MVAGDVPSHGAAEASIVLRSRASVLVDEMTVVSEKLPADILIVDLEMTSRKI